MAIRYLADVHFDHEAIIAYDNRPFDSAEEMNAALLARWNAAVADDDLTYIVGDFCASADPARWRELLGQLRGRKVLIIGNHDDPACIDASRDLLEDAVPYLELEDAGRHVVLCHYPIPSFHNHYSGWVHLYGHVHTAFEWNVAENSKRLLKNLYVRPDVCRMANVGAMLPYMDYTPRTLDEIEPHL